LLAATREPVERFLAGLPDSSGEAAARAGAPRATASPASAVDGASTAARSGSLTERVGAAARAGGVLTARLACLLDVAAAGRTDVLAAGLDRLEREGVRGRGVDYLRVEAARLSGDLERAYRLCVLALQRARPGEAEAYRVRQLAKVTRAMGRPELALPWLGDWLERFPDSPDSGAVWLERCVNASRAGVGSLGEAEEALGRARRLLGEPPVVRKAAADLAARVAAVALDAAPHAAAPHAAAPHDARA
jgi:hypothetical protein